MSTKVLMFGWEFPPHNSGGLGVACLGLTRALAEAGAKVSFVLPKRLEGLASRHAEIVFADPDTKVALTEIDSPLSPYLDAKTYELLKALHGEGLYGRSLLAEVMRYASKARRVAREVEHDVIHAHDWLSFPAALEAKRVSGKPFVAHVHATEFDRTGNGQVNQQVYDIERQGMTLADKVVAVSQFTKDIIVDKYGIDPAKVAVVHNGVNESDYRSDTASADSIIELKKRGKKIVLFVGRITVQKGPDYFIRAAEKVLKFCPDAYFIVAGSGDMERQVIREVSYRQLSQHFLFTGFLRGQELNRVFRSADLYVMPSVSEPFGLSPLESLVQGTPVLISKQTGVSEVISHALKADFWDVDDMADKIVSVLKHEPLKCDLAHNGREQALTINWSKAAKHCIMIYNNLMAVPA